MAAPEGDFLIVGTVLKPHGIKGELAVRLETDRPGEAFAPGRVLRVGDARGAPTGGAVTVERTRDFKGGLLVKTKEHAGRSAAHDALRGASLLVERSALSPPDEDEVFYHELVGLRVEAGEGPVGTVREVYEMPSGLMLAVQRPGQKELLVPFVREMVRRVDPEAGVIELDAPPGLLDL